MELPEQPQTICEYHCAVSTTLLIFIQNASKKKNATLSSWGNFTEVSNVVHIQMGPYKLLKSH